MNHSFQHKNLFRFKTIFTFFIFFVAVATATSISWADRFVSAYFNQEYQLLPEIDDVYGVAFRDINQDGFADLYLVRFRDINRLFIFDKKKKRYKDKTISASLGGNLYPSGIKNLELGSSIVDFNNDGIQDVIITGWGTTTKLFQQSRRLVFDDQTSLVGIKNTLSGNASVWADVNLDGRLDLLITNEHGKNHLYVQHYNGTFREVASDYNLNTENTSQGAGFADINLDGYPDLYICNWLSPDELYLNINGAYFDPVKINIPHLKDNINSNGVSFGDVDNDGDLDLFVSDRNGLSRLYRNDFDATSGGIKLIDATQITGISNRLPSYSGIISDLDNNGWQDIVCTNIGQNYLFLNNAGVFSRYDLSHETNHYYSTGAAVADHDRDGDLDLFISNKDTSSILYVNPETDHSYIQIYPEGVSSNRDGVGTKVWLYKNSDENDLGRSLVGYRELSGGSGYLSIGEMVAHFGVPPKGLYSAKIVFPLGKEKLVENILPGQMIKVSELTGVSKMLMRAYKTVSQLIFQISFWQTFLLIVLLIGSIGVATAVYLRRYKWSHRQTGVFLSVVLVVLYVVYAVFRGESAVLVIGSQTAVILGGLIVTFGVLEYILSVKKKRSVYRAALYNFSERLIFLRENETLYDQLVQMIYQTIHPEFCLIYVAEKNQLIPKHFSGRDDFDFKDIGISGSLQEQVFYHKIIEKKILSKDLGHLQKLNFHLLVPVVRDETLLSLIAIGKPMNVKEYDREDLNTFVLLANQTALAVENNNFIEKTRELTRQITETETQEKYITVLEKQNTELESLYSELKDAHTQLVHSEKMSSLGHLVAGVAHELNNPIGFIYGNMRELQQYINTLKNPSDDIDEQELDYIKKDIDSLILETLDGSTRVKQIVEDLRNFSRLDEAEYKRVDVHEGLDATLSILKKEIGNKITIHKNYCRHSEIECMPGQLNQVFMNLLQNAIHAIPSKGNIWIATEHTKKEMNITIADDGVGIPKDIIDKIFDPFFTTKKVGKGTGLGLSISYKIIEDHAGKFCVESHPGEKTIFKIMLPVTGNK